MGWWIIIIKLQKAKKNTKISNNKKYEQIGIIKQMSEEKSIETFNDKYGVDHYSKTEEYHSNDALVII